MKNTKKTKDYQRFSPLFSPLLMQMPDYQYILRKRGFYNHNLLQFTNVFIPTENQLFTQNHI
jgi:hypothetical protein